MSSTNLPYHVHHIQLQNSSNIAYIDEGKGEKTLLFIHGLATYALSWKKNIEYLQHHYRCIAIDLPGNGFSDREEHSFSISFFAECVAQFVEKLNLKHLCLVGHSMGGQIAIKALAGNPTLADKLILCAPAGFETYTAMEKVMYQSSIGMFDIFSSDENNLRQSILNSFYRTSPYANEMIQELTAIMHTHSIKGYHKMIERCIHGMLEEPVFNLLAQIKQPTLVLFGDKDGLIPNMFIHPVSTKQIAEQGVKQMPNAQLMMIPQCGHFLQIEKTEFVNECIHNFLKD